MDAETKKKIDEAAALCSAVQAADVPAVTALLEGGCDPNQTTDSLGTTALHVLAQVTTPANRAKSFEIGQLLLDYGARLIQNKSGITALHFAFYRRHMELLLLLILRRQPEDANPADFQKLSVMHIACTLGPNFNPSVASLLKQGANVNAATIFGHTPLHLACSLNVLSTVSLLLDQGADLEATDQNGFTPLLYCCTLDNNYLNLGKEVNEELIKRRKLNMKCLLDRGACVQVPRTSGKRTALHLLSQIFTKRNGAPCVEVAELLIQRGAYVNAQDDRRSTPLHYAAQVTEHAAFVKVLLRHGADINARDVELRSPISALYAKMRTLPPPWYNVPIGLLRVLRELLLHAQRLLALGLHVEREARNILRRMTRDKMVESVEAVCKDELQHMRFVWIDADTTLYRLLRWGRDGSNRPVDRVRLRSIMEKLEVEKEYPNYADLLQSRVRRGQLFGPAEEAMELLAGRRLPPICSEMIFDSMTEADLRNLVSVVKIDRPSG